MNKYGSLSQVIKSAADLNTPSPEYFNTFTARFKKYRQAKIRRQNLLVAFAVIIVACSGLSFINNSIKLDIDTASGGNMAQHNAHGKVVVFEGDVKEVTNFIKEHVKAKTQTLSLRDHFQADVWGVYVEGEETFRYYYQCLGNGKYTVFVIHE